MEHVSGLLYEYYHICKRKTWYFANGLAMEDENENVHIGKIIDENSYDRERKHILIDDKSNIDYFKNKTICEIKKSSSEREAAIAQIKYYLFILYNKGLTEINGELRVPKENLIEQIFITESDIKEIGANVKDIKNLIREEMPPEMTTRKGICRNCAYFEFCNI